MSKIKATYSSAFDRQDNSLVTAWWFPIDCEIDLESAEIKLDPTQVNDLQEAQIHRGWVRVHNREFEVSEGKIGNLQSLKDFLSATWGKSFSLPDLHRLWGEFGDIPVFPESSSEKHDRDSIELPFLHFKIGTPREHIWRWFEAQNKEFVVGDVMNGCASREASPPASM